MSDAELIPSPAFNDGENSPLPEEDILDGEPKTGDDPQPAEVDAAELAAREQLSQLGMRYIDNPEELKPGKKFRTAVEMLDDYNRTQPFIARQLEEERRRNEELRQELQAYRQEQDKREIRQLEERFNRIVADRDSALRKGDDDAVAMYDAERDKILDRYDELQAKAQPAPPQQQAGGDDTSAFIERNPWYQENAFLQHEANLLAKQLVDSGMQYSQEQAFAIIENKIKLQYPQFFEDQRKPAPQRKGGLPPKPGMPRGGSGGGQHASSAEQKFLNKWSSYAQQTLGYDQARALEHARNLWSNRNNQS